LNAIICVFFLIPKSEDIDMAECLGDEAGLKDLLNLSICTSDAEEIFSLRERGFSHGCPSVSDGVAGGQSVSVL
jgi:hypothetical protein